MQIARRERQKLVFLGGLEGGKAADNNAIVPGRKAEKKYQLVIIGFIAMV
jgi:hypothetical protein